MSIRQVRIKLAVLLLTATLGSVHFADAAPVAVRFSEGVTHAYLLVRSIAGEMLGQGELTQVVKEDGLVESRMMFRFKDGSLHDEVVVFSQQRVFTVIRYHLVQRGPSFPDQIDVSIDRGTGQYKVRSKSGEGAKEEILTGAVDLPKDVYNGMLITVSKNLQKGVDETVSILAFTPTPQVYRLQLLAMEDQPVRIGDQAGKATQYVFQPQVGLIKEFFGKMTGQLPASFHYMCWILVDEVPAFVQFEGPLQLMGQIVHIELLTPRVTAEMADKKRSAK
ncbi:hypothetical protein ACO9S2_00470 [Nitrospira sp. NS4]|uniref:hypothetical protein n=1 Tax=Nitrospira sp. NS4 TaxID=3414498 RepID=UPI003C2E721B